MHDFMLQSLDVIKVLVFGTYGDIISHNPNILYYIISDG